MGFISPLAERVFSIVKRLFGDHDQQVPVRTLGDWTEILSRSVSELKWRTWSLNAESDDDSEDDGESDDD